MHVSPEQIDKARIATDGEYKAELRRRCQTDLLFLGRLLGYTKLLDRVHGPVADFCVKKNPALPIEEQHSIKQRLHLDPRGTFKSTISVIDSVQWIICFPNVRICKLTATKDLAKAIANEIRNHFVCGVHSEPTVFQALFPEYCIVPSKAVEGAYTAPCRTKNWKEATVMSFSIETTISGWHFDVLDPDDVVDTQNSSTTPGVAKVKRNYRINKKTLMPYGYINFKGTRYHPFDLWGDLIEKARPGKILLKVRPALKTNDGHRLEPGVFPEPGECELLFPELLAYEFLRDEFDDDYDSFMSQYMNDSQGGNEVTFTREAMLQATRPAEEIPVSGQTFVAFRFAYQGKPTMQHFGATVGLLENGRMYILDALRGRLRPSSLAHAVVQLAKKHGAHNVIIEETPGARYLDSAIQNYALVLGWPLSIAWREYQEDDGARDLRIKGLEPLIGSNRLLFHGAIKCLPELYKQFINYGMIDDIEIPDVVARVCEALPHLIAMQEPEREQTAAWELARARDMYDRTHGLGRYAPASNLLPDNGVPRNGYGLDDCLGGLNG